MKTSRSNFFDSIYVRSQSISLVLLYTSVSKHFGDVSSLKECDRDVLFPFSQRS